MMRPVDPTHHNRLVAETSPYLVQHAQDPVDWYPWGAEARDRARDLDRPIFLSVGYAACHWCHVMHRESFTDAHTAADLNAGFVSIKVDREERPDVDSLYMDAVQSLTGSGGWPMSVFLTPDGRPFYGGTYFPDRPRHGLASFRQVLAAVGEAWRTRRDEIEASASKLADVIDAGQRAPAGLQVDVADMPDFAAVLDRRDGRPDRWLRYPDRRLGRLAQVPPADGRRAAPPGAPADRGAAAPVVGSPQPRRDGCRWHP